MRSTFRPYATAGIAVASMSLFVVAPVVPTDLQHRAVGLAAASDAVDPVGSLDLVVTTLSSAFTDTIDTVGGVLTSVQDTVDATIAGVVGDLPAELQPAFGDLVSSLPGIAEGILNGVVVDMLVAAGLPLFAGGPLGIVADIAYDLAIRELDQVALSALGVSLPTSGLAAVLEGGLAGALATNLTSLLDASGLAALLNPADLVTVIHPLIADISGFLLNLLP